MASLVQQHDLYYLQFYSADRTPKRKRVALKVSVKRDAEQIRRKLERDHALGKYDPWTDDPFTYDRVILKPETLRQAADAFLATKASKAARTVATYEEAIDRFCDHRGPNTMIATVCARDVEGWLDTTNAGTVTRHKYVRHLKVWFRWAKKEGLVEHVATDAVRLKRMPRKFDRYLSPAEVDCIVEAIRENARTAFWLADLVQLAVHTGLRRGELINLQWRHVDLDARTLTVANTESFNTKSGADRKVPLSSTALDVLQRRADERDSDASPYVFSHSEGQITADYLSRAFKKYARKAGIEDAHLHLLRHTACSWLAERGVPVEAIRRFAGHSTISVTERYMHLADDVYADKITAALAG